MDQEETSTSGTNGRNDAPDAMFKAKRYAVKFNPPCIFLEYEDIQTKRRVRAVKLNGVLTGIDVDRLTKKVIRSFPRRLEPSSIKYDQVRKLVVRLLDSLGAAGGAAGDGATRAGAGSPAASGPLRPDAAVGPLLCKASMPVADASPIASEDRSPCRVLPALSPMAGQQRQSVESGLSRFTTSTANSANSAGSDDDDDLAAALDELDKEMTALSAPKKGGSSIHSPAGSSENGSRDSSFSFRDRAAPLPQPNTRNSVLDAGPVSAPLATSVPKTRFAAEAERLVIGMEVTEDTDLNRVTEVELKLAKMNMEGDFRRNQLRPGDPGYEYDKQIEFGPAVEKNEWDDSNDEAEEPTAAEVPEVDWQEIVAVVAKPSAAVQPKTPVAAATKPAAHKAKDSTYDSNDWP